jgi:hypothetical protein
VTIRTGGGTCLSSRSITRKPIGLCRPRLVLVGGSQQSSGEKGHRLATLRALPRIVGAPGLQWMDRVTESCDAGCRLMSGVQRRRRWSNNR